MFPLCKSVSSAVGCGFGIIRGVLGAVGVRGVFFLEGERFGTEGGSGLTTELGLRYSAPGLPGRPGVSEGDLD